MKDTTKAQVTNLVKTMISRSEETKYKGINLALNANFANRISPTRWFNVIPTVAQSTGVANSYTRIGDRIKPKGLYVDCMFAIDENEARALNMQLDVFFVNHRSKKSYTALAAGAAAPGAPGEGYVELSNYLFDDGTGGKYGYDGTIWNALLPVNTDLVKVIKHKRVNLFSSATATAHGQTDSQTRRFTRLTFKIPLPSTLSYDSAISAVYPTNSAPVMGFGFVYPDGLAPSTELEPLQATIHSRLYFDDA